MSLSLYLRTCPLFVSFSVPLVVLLVTFFSLSKLFLFCLNKVFGAFSFHGTYIMIGNGLKNKFSRKQTQIPTWAKQIREMSEVNQVGTKEFGSPCSF